jgi:outer membrane biogenesis lipoprotein LolB
MDNADDGAVVASDYTAAGAAHMFEEFLEHRLSFESFQQWLAGYPADSPDTQVADEINRAVLALRAFEQGRRSWDELHRELMAMRGRLTGLARL